MISSTQKTYTKLLFFQNQSISRKAAGNVQEAVNHFHGA